MNDSAVLIALLGIFSAVVTTFATMATFSQKKVNETQALLVAAKDKQIDQLIEEKKLISEDNREQAKTIVKLGVSVDKLTEQGAKTIALLEDVFYAHDPSSPPRRRS